MAKALRIIFSNFSSKDFSAEDACCDAVVALEKKKNPRHSATYSQGGYLDIPEFHGTDAQALSIVSRFFDKTHDVSVTKEIIKPRSTTRTIDLGACFGIHTNTDGICGLTIFIQPRCYHSHPFHPRVK